MPSTAIKTPSGYAYIYLSQGDGTEFTPTTAVRLHVKAHDIVTGKSEDTMTVMTAAQAGPFFGELMAVLKLGDRIRVWGESEGRVWDLAALEVAHEYDAPADLTPPVEAEEINGARWLLLESGQGDKLTHNQAVRFHATRWDASNGAVLESTRAGEGMLALLNNDMFYQDPVHAALLEQLSPGAHARVWIAAPAQEGFVIVEDLWIVEHLEQYDIPSDLTPPDNAEMIAQGAYMRIETDSGTPTLVEGNDVKVDMTCWNADNATIIMASSLTDQETVMHLDDNLGVWFEFMKRAKRGMTFRTWTTPESMPENVGMPMTCRVIIP